MIDFEQWYEQEIGSENKPEYEAAKWAWEYQQAKIDEINEVANGWKDEYRIMTLRYEKSNKQIDELQKKLDCCREENKTHLEKIDELQRKIAFQEKAIKNIKLQFENKQIDCDRSDRKIDELQARVDEITNHVGINFDEDRDNDQHSYWSGYNQAMRELNDILKGNKDETGLN